MSAIEDAVELGTGVNGRFRVVGVRVLNGDDRLPDALGFFVQMRETLMPGGQGLRGYSLPASSRNTDRPEAMQLDIVVLEYETHIDARLGADGLRVVGFTIAGIEDMLTGQMVVSAPLKEVPQ